MKTLITTFLICSLSFNQADASIATDVAQLSALAFGENITRVNGRNADEILKNYMIQETGDEDIVLTTKEVEDMAFGDEIDQGYTTLRSAKLMGEFAESQLVEQLESGEGSGTKIKNQINNIKKFWPSLITRLAQQGARFAYSGNGSGYCGVSFIKLIVIDPKTGRVYDIYLSQSGTC